MVVDRDFLALLVGLAVLVVGVPYLMLTSYVYLANDCVWETPVMGYIVEATILGVVGEVLLLGSALNYVKKHGRLRGC